MIDFFRSEQPIEYVGVMHAQAPHDAERMAADLRKELPDHEIPIGQIGCVLGWARRAGPTSP